MTKNWLDFLVPRCEQCGRSMNEVKLGKLSGQILCESCINTNLYGAPPVIEKPKEPDIPNWNELVTPKTFDTYIGQEVIKKELKTMLAATEKHGIQVQHVLFSGGFGLGKTTIAKIFAKAVGDNAVVNAANIKNLSEFPEAKVVVVDEIHTIRDEEWLLSLMDKGKQTILGATTTAGTLSGPLRSRFISLVLQPYTVDELKRMVLGAADNLKYNCPEYVAEEVAKRGKTIARVSLFLFKRVYDRVVLNNGKVSPQELDAWFSEMKIDIDGLDNADRAYISCLSEKPVGLQYLTAMTGMDRITLEETVEPYLLARGFVRRTPRGRMLGNKQTVGVWN